MVKLRDGNVELTFYSMLPDDEFQHASATIEGISTMLVARAVEASGCNARVLRLKPTGTCGIDRLSIVRSVVVVGRPLAVPDELLLHLPIEHVEVFHETLADEDLQPLRILIVDLKHDFLRRSSMRQMDAHLLRIRG